MFLNFGKTSIVVNLQTLLPLKLWTCLAFQKSSPHFPNDIGEIWRSVEVLYMIFHRKFVSCSKKIFPRDIFLQDFF